MSGTEIGGWRAFVPDIGDKWMQAYKDLHSSADVQLDMWDHKGRRYVRLGSATFSCTHIQVLPLPVHTRCRRCAGFAGSCGASAHVGIACTAGAAIMFACTACRS